MQNTIIKELDIENVQQILDSKPHYIEVNFELFKQKSGRISNSKDKPKKKKNLEIELLANNPKPVLNLNLKSQNTKVIISTNLEPSDLCYRKLQKIKKQIKAYNPFLIKLIAEPVNDSQNNNLIRLLVSKTKKEKLAIVIKGKYELFWSANQKALGSFEE